MTPLIDATEMYLRTVWELEEEGIPPIRARLVERLQLSAPAVSETVARLDQEGLLRINEDRTLQLTDAGRDIAVSVMRKHRLAERLLTDVIGLEWEQAHNEACRWEHVISDRVEERLVELLGDPETSPFGNPIRDLGRTPSWNADTLSVAAKEAGEYTVEHISEHLQVDVAAMAFLHEHGLEPGAATRLSVDEGHVVAEVGDRPVRVPAEIAELVYVAQRPA